MSHASWPKTDIDRFVLARLEQRGARAGARRRQAHADPARHARPDRAAADRRRDRRVRERRAPDAFAKVVDRLLASPHYGETWGRVWLDVARYGEDDYRSLDPKQRGYNPYPNAYLYRDWVIKAFNDDLPYDQFVRAQLAGDLLGDPATRARTLPALGFLGLGPWYYDNGAVEITRADERHDRVDVVSRGFLGLTVGCARCHDHKYDPISDAGLLLAGRRVPQYRRTTSTRSCPRASSTSTRRRTSRSRRRRSCSTSSRGPRSTQLSETLALQASKYMAAAWKVHGRAEGRGREGRRRREAGLRAVRPLAQVPREAAAVLSVLDQVAGDDQGGRHGGRGEEAGGRVPGAAARRDVRSEGDQGRERHHRAPRRCPARRRRSRRSCPATSSPTTTSAPAAGWS